MIDSVFVGLKDTSHVAAHCKNFVKVIVETISCCHWIINNNKKTSVLANKRMFEPMSNTISFMYKRKSKGPKIDP